MSQALFRTAKLNVSYAGPPAFALSIDEFELFTGQAVLLYGANGSGKSTLLRILAGLDDGGPDAQFAWQGQNGLRPQIGKDLSFLPQHPYIFKTTVQANVAYPLKRCGLPVAHATESLRWAGLDQYAKMSAAKLSGGQQRRLALARIHAMPAPLVLLDEPTAHLDANGASAVAKLVGELARAGRTILASSHDERLAESFAPGHRIAMQAGCIRKAQASA